MSPSPERKMSGVRSTSRILSDMAVRLTGCNKPAMIGPKFIPQTATDELIVDLLIFELHITNNGGSNATVYVKDKQATPCDVIPSISLAPSGMVSMDSAGGRLSPGGVTWQSSQPNVTGYILGLSK